MIKSVVVTNYRGEQLALELTKPEASGFIVKEISGIGPDKADILSSENATNDGSRFNSARMKEREIVFDLEFLGTPTIEDTRHKSYRYFPLKKQVLLTFVTSNRICYIGGYVASNEPDIFSKNEGTKISIICPNPFFYSVEQFLTVFYGIQPMFEFVFSNESLTEPLLEMSSLNRMTEQTIYYDGDADVGIVIHLIAFGPAKNISIYNTETREEIHIDTDKLANISGASLGTGDEIIITTIKGQKSARLLRNGKYSNVLNCLGRNSNWFQLKNGDNVFTYTAEEGATNLQFRIEHQVVYEGI